MLRSLYELTRIDVSVWKHLGALSMAAILLPATCVLAPVFAYFHALTVPKVFLPPTIVNVNIAPDCQLTMAVLFSFRKLPAVDLILLV